MRRRALRRGHPDVHGPEHRDGQFRGRAQRGARCGSASCRGWDGDRRGAGHPDGGRLHRGRRPGGVHPDGELLPEDGDRRDGDLRHRLRHCGAHPDGACPARWRRGCCRDAGRRQLRNRDAVHGCRRHGCRCGRRGHRNGACPVTWQRGCCRDAVRPGQQPSRQPGLQLQQGPQVRPVPVLQALRGQVLPVPEHSRHRAWQPESAPSGPERQPGQVPLRRPWGLLRELQPGPVLPGRNRQALLPWGMRREVSSRRGPQWLKKLNERIRPFPAVLSVLLLR